MPFRHIGWRWQLALQAQQVVMVGRLLNERDRALEGSIREKNHGHATWKGSKFDIIPKYFPSLMDSILGIGIQDEQQQITAFMELFLFIGQLIKPNF